MKNRNVIPTALMALLMIACCREETYEVIITGIESRVLTLDGVNFIEYDMQTPIDKEDLIIEITLNEVERIASSEHFKNKKTDAQVLKAAVVPCGDQIVIYKNRLESVKVEVLDSDNNDARIDITSQVIIQGTQKSISEYISENNPGIRGFLIELSDISNIPDRIEYEIEATLNDGTKINASNGIIAFN